MTIQDNQFRASRLSGQYDVALQTILSGVSSLPFRQLVTGSATVYVQASIPEGKDLVVFDRTVEAQTGLYFIDVCSVSSFAGGTEAGVVRRALRKGATPVQTVLRTGVTPVDLTVLEYGQQDNGSATGNSRPTGVPAVNGALTIINGENNVIRIQRTGTGTSYITFRLICWEL